jgi:hypothetical protein
MVDRPASVNRDNIKLVQLKEKNKKKCVVEEFHFMFHAADFSYAEI